MRNLVLITACVLVASVGVLAQDLPSVQTNPLQTSNPDDYGVMNMPSKWEKMKEEKRMDFLFSAVERGDLPLAQKMLPDVRLPYYQYDNNGETLLTLAIENGNYEMVAWLMEDAVVNLKNESGETPLTLAIKKQNTGIIDLVLERAKADLPNDHDETPLVLAINYGYEPAFLQQLTDKGAKPDRKSNGVTPLSRAVEKENVQATAMLLRAGADPSIPNTAGTIPLYQAVRSNHSVLAGVLLHRSAQPMEDANWETPRGETLINMAVTQENAALVRVLVEGGAYVNATDYLDNTALNLAAERGMADVVRLLLDYGADPNHANIMGTTPIMASAQRGHTEIATLLAEYGADPDQRDFSGIAANDYGDYNVLFSDPYLQEEVEGLLREVNED